MKILKMDRSVVNDDRGIISLVTGLPSHFYILERPWLRNIQNISCIPEGEYKAQIHVSDRFGKTFMLRGVPGRSGIMFHWGNWIRDSRGCMLPGVEYNDDPESELSVGHSHKTFNYMMRQLAKTPRFKLIIK